MVRPQYNFTNLYEFIDFLLTALGYLEKDNCSNLGDFSAEGKVVNAGYNNYTVYWDFYKCLGYGNYQGQAYCACGVCTMLVSAFGLEKAKKLLCGNLYIYCPDGYDRFKAKCRIYNEPKVGDVVFFWNDSLGRWGHTGLVIGVDDNKKGYTTWEANTSSGNDIVVRNGGATCRKHYTIGCGKKVAFGRPDYEGNGISTSKIEEKAAKRDEYAITMANAGLECVVSSTLNVRNEPGGPLVIGSIRNGEKVFATKKCFINGAPWFYIPAKNGWVSAKYFKGWIQENTCSNKWWYVLPGYEYYVHSIQVIDGDPYYFDDAGYMFVGKITFETDCNGVLKNGRSEEE